MPPRCPLATTRGLLACWASLPWLILAACDGSPTATVILQLKTDLVAGVEFDEVRAALTVGDTTRHADLDATLGLDFVEGQRVAEWLDVPTGTANVQVEMVDRAGVVIASRPLRATYGAGAHAFTVLISRRCRGLTCPGAGDPATATACVDGACRDPACSEENPTACGEAECGAPTDCAAGSMCTEASCVAGRCLYRSSTDACTPEEWCDPEAGCRALPSSDAGVPQDAGTPDACAIMSCDAGPPPPPVLEPASNGCAEADATGFVEVGRLATSGEAYGMWARPPYVLVATTTGGLASYTFDGVSFTQVDQATGLGWVEAIWSDGALYFVSAPGTGLWTFEVDGDGSLRPVGGVHAEVPEARRGWSDGAHVYVPNGADGLSAFGLTGTSLALAGSTAATFAQAAYVDGSTVLLADLDALRAYTFDGSAFTEVDSAPVNRAGRIWGVDGTLHVAHEDGLGAFELAGAGLTPGAQASTLDRARDVWSDGVHVFAAAESAGVYAYRHDAGGYTEVDRVDTDGAALGLVGDGTYLYVGDGPAGIKAYAGFACRRAR